MEDEKGPMDPAQNETVKDESFKQLRRSRLKLVLVIVVVLLVVSNIGILVYSQVRSEGETSQADTNPNTEQESQVSQNEPEPQQATETQNELSQDQKLTYETVMWSIAGLTGSIEAPTVLLTNTDEFQRALGVEPASGFANNGCKYSVNDNISSCYWVAALFEADEGENDFSELSYYASRADEDFAKDYCSLALEDSFAVQVKPDTERYVTLCGHKTGSQTFIDLVLFTKFSFDKDQQISRNQFKDMANNALMYVGFDYIGPHQALSSIHIDYDLFSSTAAGQEMIKILRSVKYDE